MVAIPKSGGVSAPLSTQRAGAEVNMQFNQLIPKAISEFGSDITVAAKQYEYQQAKEEDAFNTAQLIDYRTKQAKFDNEQEIKLQEISANDPKAMKMAKESFLKERNKFIEETYKDYQSNPKLTQLVNQHASVSSVDVEANIDRTLFRKKKEYSENKFYEGVYAQEQNLSKVKDEAGFNSIKSNLNALFQSGLQSGIIDQKAIISLRDRQQRLVEDRQKELEANETALKILDGSYRIDPNNSDDRKLGDQAFSNAMNLAAQKGQNVEEVAANFVSKQGYVPARMKQVWSGHLNSGTPEEKMAIASRMIDLAESNPHLENQFNGSDYAYAQEIHNRTNIGIPPSKAVEYADKAILDYKSLNTQAKLELFNSKASKELRKDGYSDFTSSYESFFSANPSIEDGLKNQFEQNVKDIMLNTAGVTHESAISLAAQQMKREYAVTNIGNKRIMKYAPEVMYRKYGEDTGWIEKQFKDLVGEEDLKKYTLTIDQSTIDKKPTYKVSKFIGDKIDYVRDSNNQPMRFTPDFTKSETYQKAKKAREERFKAVPEKEVLKGIEEKEAATKQYKENIVAGQPTTIFLE